MKISSKKLLLGASLVVALITVFILSGTVKASPPTRRAADLSAGEITEMLNAHNDWRQRYSVPPVTWDPAVAAVAQDWANQIAATGNFSHRQNNQYGENILFWSSGSLNPTAVVGKWGAEVNNYDFASNTCAAGKTCGHFTQIVWSTTTGIGCGKATGNGFDYYVCNYNPPGNFIGQTPGASPASASATAQPTIAPTATTQAVNTVSATLEPTNTTTAATVSATTEPTSTTTTATQPITGTVTPAASTANVLLDAHNEWRQKYGVPALVWDDTVAAVAQDWANQIAASNKFEHRPNNKFGENIWAGTTGFFVPTDAVNSWGSEVANYDFTTNTCKTGEVCGHFTQLVWSTTTKVGCGKAAGNGNDYYVCNYDPPGNFIGQTPGARLLTPTPTTQPTNTPTATIQPTHTPMPTTQAGDTPVATAVVTNTLTPTPEAGNGVNGPTASEIAALLNKHNEWRQKFKVAPLVWDNTVADVAQDWANQIAASGNFVHRPDNKYGENMFFGAAGFRGPADVVDGWGNEVEDYDFTSNTCADSKSCVHFTQLVWAATTKVGCGKVTANGNDFYVCNYDPPGNVPGQTPGASPAVVTPTPQPTNTPTPTAVPATTTAAPNANDVTSMLSTHNEWRQKYGVPPLVWDDAVAAAAQDWANQAASGTFVGPPTDQFGQNIWAGSTGFVVPADAVNNWGSEVENYDFATNTCADGKTCAHFTQLVWSTTTKLGCGKATGRGNDFYVCYYDPPGNIQGQTPGAIPAAAQATVAPTGAPTETPVPAGATPTNTDPASAIDFRTPNQVSPGGSVLWYTVPYDGTNPEFIVRVPQAASNGLGFWVYTPSEDPTQPGTTHSGNGSPEGDDLVWRTNSTEMGNYLVVVFNNTTVPMPFTITTQ